jgi:hypothetical protein
MTAGYAAKVALQCMSCSSASDEVVVLPAETAEGQV